MSLHLIEIALNVAPGFHAVGVASHHAIKWKDFRRPLELRNPLQPNREKARAVLRRVYQGVRLDLQYFSNSIVQLGNISSARKGLNEANMVDAAVIDS